MWWQIIAQAFWIILPAYIANACALLLGGGKSIDFGKKWKDGRRILGDGKTWRGLISGTVFGMAAGFGFAVAAKYISTTEFAFIGLTDFTGFPFMIPIIFSICCGALLGDVIESFLKRRLGKIRGEDWIPFDQMDFILGVLFFSFLMAGILQLIGLTNSNWFYDNLSIWHVLFLMIVTPFIHIVANISYKKIKNRK